MRVSHICIREEDGSKHLFRVGVSVDISPGEYAARIESTYWARHHRRTPAVLIAIDGGKKA